MRLLLTLTSLQRAQQVTLNYQYPLSAAIYKIMERAEKDYSRKGKKKGPGKRLSVFTFILFSIALILYGKLATRSQWPFSIKNLFF